MERIRADINDLKLERWLRRRDAGLIVWKTKGGHEIQLKNMSDSHLDNAINHLVSKHEEADIVAEYEAMMDCRGF